MSLNCARTTSKENGDMASVGYAVPGRKQERSRMSPQCQRAAGAVGFEIDGQLLRRLRLRRYPLKDARKT